MTSHLASTWLPDSFWQTAPTMTALRSPSVLKSLESHHHHSVVPHGHTVSLLLNSSALVGSGTVVAPHLIASLPFASHIGITVSGSTSSLEITSFQFLCSLLSCLHFSEFFFHHLLCWHELSLDHPISVFKRSSHGGPLASDDRSSPLLGAIFSIHFSCPLNFKTLT